MFWMHGKVQRADADTNVQADLLSIRVGLPEMRIGLRAECVRVYSLQSADEDRSHLLMVANNEFDLTS